jgi:hypothetical protein
MKLEMTKIYTFTGATSKDVFLYVRRPDIKRFVAHERDKWPRFQIIITTSAACFDNLNNIPCARDFWHII